MDDVIYTLRAFFCYLCENDLYHDNFWMLLAALVAGIIMYATVCHLKRYPFFLVVSEGKALMENGTLPPCIWQLSAVCGQEILLP